MSEGNPGKAATLPGGHGAPASTVGSLVGVADTIDAHGETVAPAPHDTPLEGHAATLPGPGVASDLTALVKVDAASYAIGPELARGGMGKILSARDRRLRRDVVIKVTRHEGELVDPRFEREALITARLQHPSIVRVYEAGVLSDGRAFYAMERVRGRSLEVVLDETTTLEERLALLPHAIAVADAIAYAHSEGVLHRDLKPSNVLIGPFGETVVIDWGLAKDLRAVDTPLRPDTPVAEESGSSSDSSLTHAGAVLGTPSYMAPEQARGDAVDERTDIYALGTLLYTLLSGTPPYRGHSTDEVIELVASGRRKPIVEREPRVPPELATIVEHAMALDPADRYQSAKQLADELRQFAAGKLVASHEYGLWELLKRWVWRHRITVGVSLFAAIVLIVVLVLSFQSLKVAKEEAEIEKLKAERATDKVLLDQAKAMLDIDPSRAAAWLRKASDQALAEPRAHEIAVDAARRGLARAFVGHGNDVEHVILSPDGKHVATGSDDGTARWWELDTGTSIVLKGHVGPIETMTMSDDGKYLATAGTDHDVWLWELAAGRGRKLAGHGATVRGVAFSPDGTQLASTSEDGTFRLWDIASGTGRELMHHTHGLRAVTWTRDGRIVLAGGYDGVIARIDPISGAARLQQAHTAELRMLVVSPDNTFLAAGDEDGVATLWTVEGQRLRTLGSHIDVCRKLAFTPDGAHLASAGGDEIVRVYSIPDGPTIELKGNLAGIKDMAISPDGTWVASAGIDTTVWVWPITGGKGRRFTGHPNAVKGVAFTRDGRIISGSEDDTARIWRLDVEEPPEGPALRNWLFARSNVDVR